MSKSRQPAPGTTGRVSCSLPHTIDLAEDTVTEGPDCPDCGRPTICFADPYTHDPAEWLCFHCPLPFNLGPATHE
jgi:hypothetical protein